MQLGREGVEEPQRRADRLLAVHRRPAGRARAGHHDRRRLPLLRDRAAQVHPRRHARATSSTRATWRPAPRRPTSRSCWSTRGTACACSRGGTRASRGCSASPTSCSPSTRWTWSTSTARSSTTSVDDFDEILPGAQLHADPDERAARRQRHHARASARRGSTGQPLLEYLETVEVDRSIDRRAVPLPGAAGAAARPRVPRLRRADRLGHGARRRSRHRLAVGPLARASSGSSPGTATSTWRFAPMSVTLTLDDEIDISRGDVLAIGAVAGRPAVRGRGGVDGRAAARSGPRLPAEAHARGR